MKIQKIETITKYKSFKDYSWPRFLNTDNFHQKINIIFGENGSGKSSFCNILKSVSHDNDFYRYFPDKVNLKVDNKGYEYSNRSWQDQVSQGSFLFFDREFVDNNVHLGRLRGTQQGEQEQKSGNLIIEFDSKAIKLREKTDELLKIKDNKKSLLDQYQVDNQSILDFSLTEDEERLFRKYKNRGKNKIDDTKKLLEERKSGLEGKIKADSKLQQKVAEIQQISGIDEVDVDMSLSRKSVYQSLFNFSLKEKVKIKADKDLISKIAKHKDFFEQGLEIRQEHANQCPFCQAKNREREIKQLIKVYGDMYDESYKEQKEIFEKNKQILIDELDRIKETYHNTGITQIFLKLKKLSDQYSIKSIYSVDEDEEFNQKIAFPNIDALRERIERLERPSKENVSSIYLEVKNEYLYTKKFLMRLSKLIVKKIKIIESFRNEHTDTKIKGKIERNQTFLGQLTSELDFIRGNNLDNEKLRREKLKKLKKLQGNFDNAKENHRITRETYQEYCSTDAFSKTLNKIESYFQYFNFDFTLQLDTQNRHTASMTELPFAFKVLDHEGKERDLREGLSEGEIQVLSICFFLAFLDIQGEKDKKILVFDDPITSLDDSNLSNLVDLMAKEKNSFSQIFILTHHRTFFKFLRKKFNKNCNEYLILRNRKHLGGSFICKSREERFIRNLKGFENHLLTIARNSNGFDIELKTVEYGQYLRYETEHFIKCRLLHWDKSNNFADVVDGIKQNNKITDVDLDKIKQIYSFCNWTTSHVDVGDDHGLSQLKEKINDFVDIYDRYKSTN